MKGVSADNLSCLTFIFDLQYLTPDIQAGQSGYNVRMKRKTINNLRVGVIGAGYLGKFHAEKYAAMKKVDLVAVVDIDHSRAAKVAKQYGAVAYSRLEEIYSKVDAVSVVVPTSQHHTIAKKLLMQGIDLLLEKPITVTVPEASDIIRIAQKKKCILQVGHLERFNAAWRAVDTALDKPRFIEAHRLGPFQSRGTDVDVILDLMIHDIDIVLKYVPSPIKRIDSVGVPVLSPNVDIANVRLHFQCGAVANLTASRVSGKRTRKIRFFQPDVYVSVDYDTGKAQIFKKISIKGSQYPEIVGEENTIEQTDSLQAELESFIECVKTRRPPEVGGIEGKKALQVAQRILRKMRMP